MKKRLCSDRDRCHGDSYTSPFKASVGASLLAKGAVTSKRVLFASKLAPTPERATGYALPYLAQTLSDEPACRRETE